jgi:Tol biopolymer transport system component
MRLSAFGAAAVLALLVISPANAQYFGANKIQHKTFTFEVLTTDHFDVYFYPEERVTAEQAAQMAERWYARLSRILDLHLSGRQPLILYASHPDFEQTNVISGALGEGTGGVTEMTKRRIVLPLAGTLAESDHVIGHELVHAFQYDLSEHIAGVEGGGGRGIAMLPLWFVEGMAEYLSLGPVDPHTAMWIRDAAREGTLPTIRQLGSSKYFPYRWGQAFWAYVAGRYGDRTVGQMLDAAEREGSVDAAIKGVLKVEPNELSKEWQASIHEAYDPITMRTHAPDSFARAITAAKQLGAELNVSPSISPDGTQVIYFSERNLLSVDMVLADVRSGRIVRTLAKTALDPHFSSLQFIGSAGSWSADSRQFAFGAVSNGQAELVIQNIGTGRIEREIPFATLGEIFSPTWAPDGHAIAFSATSGGVSDLFLYDLTTSSLQRVTDDAYGDVQPSWSPDGQSIAFVTERFGGDLALLEHGDYRLARYDIDSRRIIAVDTTAGGKNINPMWAPDGRSLYFVSDGSGISNVYSVDVATGATQALTDVRGGISGITALSPAISAAQDARALAFSAYENGGYRIYVADIAALSAHDLGAVTDTTSPAALPPIERVSNELTTLLTDAVFGLPERARETAAYHPRLSIDAVGQPYITAGVDSFGTFVGGGVGVAWSDMLGNHNLLAAVQTDSSFGGFSDLAKNTAGMLAYQNQTHRWNWGTSVQQVPYLSGGLSSAVGIVNGGPVQVDQLTVIRQTNRGVTGLAAYPFTAARRVEFSSSYQQVTFGAEVRTTVSSLYTGEVLRNDTQNQTLADTLHLANAGAAMVFDTSLFGATSPVAGRRYRLEVTPTAGSIFFTGVLADYRRYFTPAPFYTIATRVLHYGRYGSGAEDYRLPPLFIGYPQLVRGYDLGSFDATECRPNASSACPVFDRLQGSRMLVGNVELRFPLLRPFGVTQRMYGPVPIEVALFADGGTAWTSTEAPAARQQRAPVTSTGITLRVNLFGFAVGQFDMARPLQRPGRGWLFEFSLAPGF